ncbi:SDR family oxidoreductase [Saccharibacillus sacchari]|uniref:SDR family oxidoreductase n=1 Tax=Saccharibacillus sacchari TaxID=456493 RepID=A0ACC6PIR7_9BACL
MKVLVTGANGFVGSAIVRELQQRGHETVGLVRSKEAAERLEKDGVRTIRGSIESEELLRNAAKEMDAVIHTAFFHKFSQAGFAAKTRILLGGSPSNIPTRFMGEAVGAECRAIRALGEGLSRNGGTIVIAIPTMTLKAGAVGKENDAGEPGSVGGGRVASERTLFELERLGISPSLVRLPPIVYGTGDRGGLLPSLIRIARSKNEAAYVGDGMNRWAAVHRSDAAKLFALAAEQGAAGSRFHAVAENGMPFRQIAESIGRHTGKPVRSLQPEKAGAYFGWLASFAAADNPVSSEQTRERLGWKPEQRSLSEEMEQGDYFKA